MRKTELENLSLDQLKELYLEENKKLQSALLDGVGWKELTEQRKIVVTIGVVIDGKTDQEKKLM